MLLAGWPVVACMFLAATNKSLANLGAGACEIGRETDVGVVGPAINPEPNIVALRSQIYQLARSVDRFASQIPVEKPHQQPKEVKRPEKGRETRERGAQGRDNRRRRKRR